MKFIYFPFDELIVIPLSASPESFFDADSRLYCAKLILL